MGMETMNSFADQAAPASANKEASGSGAYSETNNQVSGVDEPDIIKTDGQFVYAIANSVVSIIKAVPADQATVTATIKLNGLTGSSCLCLVTA
jgi:uncharacterized secreted protein with C-terminal beta-propeller domain